jgi:Peptidase_C39 like family
VGQGRRIDRSRWPDSGPYRQLLALLDRVHEENGVKSLRVIASRMTVNSPTRVGHMLRGVNETLPADMRQLEELVRALGGGDDDVSRGKVLYDRTLRARLEGRVGNERLAQPVEVSPRRRGSSFPRWVAILVAVAVPAVAGIVIWVVSAHQGGPGQSAGVPGPAGGGLSMQGPPWAITDNGRQEDTLAPGSPVRYAFEVYNSTGRTLSANVRFDAYWGTRDQRQINIFDVLFEMTVPPGRIVIRSPPASVPRDALPGAYTEQADIADRVDPTDRAGQYGVFNVAGKTLLNVPYLTQSGGRYDGAACVAMVLGSRPGPARPTVGDVQAVIAGSVPGQGASGAARPVAGEELENALEHYGVAQTAVTQISLDEQGLPQAQITEIAIAVKHGSPVIVFTDGKDLPAGNTGGRGYTGHWLVVVGFGFDPAKGTQVLVNDPDDIPGHGGIKGQPISISTFEQAVTDAASVPAAQQEPNHIAGIIVAG